MIFSAAAPALLGCSGPLRPGSGGEERKMSTGMEGCSAAAAAPSCSGNAPLLCNLAAEHRSVVRSEDNKIRRSLSWRRFPKDGSLSVSSSQSRKGVRLRKRRLCASLSPSVGNSIEDLTIRSIHQQQQKKSGRGNVRCHVVVGPGDVVLGEGLLVPFLDEERVEHAKEWAHQTRRICLFVEPSPFAYICGYKNRFQNFIRYLRELGDEVLIVTTDKGVPSEFYGAKVVGSWSFPCPWYENLFLSLALSPRIYRQVRAFKPDIIHASSPGIMVFGALVIAKLLKAPLVMSYHTHVPMYIPKYAWSWLVIPMWWVIRFLHRAADWTLVVSQVLGNELRNKGAAAADRIGVWSKGVDSERFHPRFRSSAKRAELLQGRAPNAPLLVHVGRLGAEKNLEFLREVMAELPELHLAIVGDGPHRKELERVFAGMSVTFTGMLTGDDLSRAYASGDVFITPSETETLGFVVLEAMASGMPVVAARAGGIIDIVNREGETGYLYTPGDVHDCVSKVKALLESSELRTKIGRAAREEVENFDWRASTRQVRNEMYSSAVWCWRQTRLNRFSWLTRWTKKQQQPSLVTE